MRDDSHDEVTTYTATIAGKLYVAMLVNGAADSDGRELVQQVADLERHRDRLQELNTELTLKNRDQAELLRQTSEALDLATGRVAELEGLLKLAAHTTLVNKPAPLPPVLLGDVWESRATRIRFECTGVRDGEARMRRQDVSTCLQWWYGFQQVLGELRLVRRNGHEVKQ